MSCDVDVDKWQKENQTPLFAEKRNRWLFAVALPSDASADDIMSLVRDAMTRWFTTEFLDTFTVYGRTWILSDEEFNIGPLGKARVHAASKSPLVEFPARGRREGLKGELPTLKPGPVMYVELQFDYHGNLKSVPWLTYTAGRFASRTTYLCPKECDVMLLAWADALEGAEDATSWVERAATGVLKPAGSALGQGIASVASPLGIKGILAIAASVAAYLWYKQKLEGPSKPSRLA